MIVAQCRRPVTARVGAIRIWFDFQRENETAANPLNAARGGDQKLVWFPADGVDFTIELFGLSIPVISAPEFLQVA
jgi:hypothetical protein